MKARSLLALTVLTVLLWFVPSIGTRGMGTIGQRVPHPDAMLFDTMPAQRSAAMKILGRADTVAETALAR